VPANYVFLSDILHRSIPEPHLQRSAGSRPQPVLTGTRCNRVTIVSEAYARTPRAPLRKSIKKSFCFVLFLQAAIRSSLLSGVKRCLRAPIIPFLAKRNTQPDSGLFSSHGHFHNPAGKGYLPDAKGSPKKSFAFHGYPGVPKPQSTTVLQIV